MLYRRLLLLALPWLIALAGCGPAAAPPAPPETNAPPASTPGSAAATATAAPAATPAAQPTPESFEDIDEALVAQLMDEGLAESEAVLLALTAPPAAGGSGAGACSLASTEEVTAALGQSIVSQDEKSDAESSTCDYFSVAGPVLVLTYAAGAPEEAQSILEAARADDTAQAIEGVGDEAYYWDCFLFV